MAYNNLMTVENLFKQMSKDEKKEYGCTENHDDFQSSDNGVVLLRYILNGKKDRYSILYKTKKCFVKELKNMIKKQNQRAEFGNTLAKPLSTEE
jgi:hypothetical protein